MIIGGIFNDGPTRWFFAIPFVFIFFQSIRVRSIWYSLVAIIAMIALSTYLLTTPLVYPVIGTSAEVKASFSVRENKYNPGVYRYEARSSYDGKNTDSDSSDIQMGVTSRNYYGVGDTLTVVEVKEEGTPVSYRIKFRDPQGREFYLNLTHALRDAPDWAQGSFCDKVSWGVCEGNRIYVTNFPNTFETKDPMRPILRGVSNLMYYPIFPILLPNLVLMWRT